MLGDPDCPHCHGAGYVRHEVPLGDPNFGRLEACVCRSAKIAGAARARLFEMSRLDSLSHLSFENFAPRGNKNAKFMTPVDLKSLAAAKEIAESYAHSPQGWLLLEGGYGSGKTHLAAAIANFVVNMGTPTLFITVPDLLDSLRFAYSDPDTTFEAHFEEIRTAAFLVLDDFGTQNATNWAQEKLFQIMNFRYINKLPTVITTNLKLDEIESRIRSRLQDEEFVNHVLITAPDFRRPTETSNPGLSMLSRHDIMSMTLKSFETREDEIGKEIVTTTAIEKQDRFGNKVKSREITRVKVTQEDVKNLSKAFHAAAAFAEEPEGWLVFLGESYCGKTHLAAAIANYRIAMGGPVIMVKVAELPEYLRKSFQSSSEVPFDRRLFEIKTTPMLIFDDLKERAVYTAWFEDKISQILDHRYDAHLTTVITSTLTPDDFAINYPSLWNRLLDEEKVHINVIDMPPYRRTRKAGRSSTGQRKGK